MKFCLLGAAVLLAGITNAAIPGLKLEAERWTYKGDGLAIHGILLKPEGEGPFPAVVISHGSSGDAEGFSLSKAREMVKWGFVCIGTNYTFMAVPVGQRPKIAPEGPPGTSAAERKENLKRLAKCIAILESLPYVDRKRIAAYGNSEGALLTIDMAATMPHKVAAAAITAGGIGGGFGGEDSAEKIRCPFLIIHGGADKTVPSEASVLLKQVLDRNHVNNSREVFDGIGHNVHGDSRQDVFMLLREWFTKYGILR